MAAHTRRTLRLLPGLVAASLLVAALFAMPMAPAVADTGTYVRLAQLAPDAAGVAMTVTSAADPSRTVMLAAVPYGSVSEYQRLEPGDYVVAIKPPGAAGTPTVTAALKAVPGASYTLAAVGDTATTGLTILTDDLTPPATGGGRVRVISAASGFPVLDVRGPDGAPFALGLMPGQASPYRNVAAGTLGLSAGAPGAAASALSVPVAANQVLTAVVVSSGGALALSTHVDAAGPTTVPPGPVDAGYGGAADPRGPLPALLLGSLAVAAAAVSMVQSRRGRQAQRGGTC